jgi:hypothetical protein
MGTGAFLASQAENQLFAGEIADEARELAGSPRPSGADEVESLARRAEEAARPEMAAV